MFNRPCSQKSDTFITSLHHRSMSLRCPGFAFSRLPTLPLPSRRFYGYNPVVHKSWNPFTGFKRPAMAPPTGESRKVVEGLFGKSIEALLCTYTSLGASRLQIFSRVAIHKPKDVSSAGVLRDLETHFNTSSLFAPWLVNDRRRMIRENAKARAIRNLKVKLGHGGTLDPMATGVLVVGVGKGTKLLGRFLECTKSYDCVVLFGAATDSYDAVGKVVSKAPYEHITKEMVEAALSKFRGTIMQKPSIFSALKVDGKKMYEYARAGGEIPEVKAREVTVESLEMLEWLEPGTHEFTWPKEEVEPEEMKGAESLIKSVASGQEQAPAADDEKRRKRSRTEDDDGPDATIIVSESAPKKLRLDEDTAMSGGLPVEESQTEGQDKKHTEGEEANQLATPQPSAETSAKPANSNPTSKPMPPAARLRMTVTSGFYVRSLCHDLGLAVGSLGLMSSLVRTRQGDYELGENVVEYDDFKKGELVWGPKVEMQLEKSMEEENWKAQEVVMDEQEYQEILRELENKKRAEDNESPGGKKHWGTQNKGRNPRGKWKDGRPRGGGR